MTRRSDLYVGFVNSLEMVNHYRDLSANSVLMAIGARSGFAEVNSISFEDALAIRWCIEYVKVGFVIPRMFQWGAEDIGEYIQQVNQLEPDFISIDTHLFQDRDALDFVLEEIKASKVVHGLELMHDDDPKWLEDDIAERQTYLGPDVKFVVTVLPDVNDGLIYLKDEAGRYPEDVVLDDLIRLAKRFDILFNIGSEKERDLEWFFRALPLHVGLAVYLAGRNSKVRSREVDEVTASILIGK